MHTKSNHKHQYESCLLEMEGLTTSIILGKRCSICGRTKIVEMFISEKDTISNCYRLLHREEILEKYKELPIYKFNWNMKYT